MPITLTNERTPGGDHNDDDDDDAVPAQSIQSCNNTMFILHETTRTISYGRVAPILINNKGPHATSDRCATNRY